MRHWRLALLLAGVMTSPTKIAAEPQTAAPATRIDRTVDRLHGVDVPDPYRWLEESNSPEVRAWVQRQNASTRSVLDRLPGRSEIQARLNVLLDSGTITTPRPVRGRYFYLRREGKQNQPILYVREGVHGPDRALVDPNTLAIDGTVALDWWEPNRDGNLLAYGLSRNGSEQSTLHVRVVGSGKDLPDEIPRTRYASLAWLPDGKGFYYTRYPKVGSVPKGEEDYHHHVYFHRLGSLPASDAHVFGVGRPAEDMPAVDLSPDGRWLVVTEHQGWAKAEVYLRDLSRSDAGFVPLVEKKSAVYEVLALNDRLYIRTNEGAPRYRLFAVDPSHPAREDWVELLAQSDDVLSGFQVVGNTLAAEYMHKASSRLELFDRQGKHGLETPLPTLGTVASPRGEWDGKELFFGFQSFTIPPAVYRVDLKDRRMELWQRVEASGDFGAYEVEQVRYRSKDGTPITMFLAHKKGLEHTGKNPTLLNAYGGFNISITPTFVASRFIFLERGGLLAIPNLRGGGEYGEAWHEAGMLGKKQNVFDDFLAAAEWLAAHRYTDRQHLVIQGGSNGGLLVGAALTQRPDLFRAVVCQVPLLDMLRYHKFLIARLWIPEYGSADDREQFKWLYAYSPYHHVREGTPYPAVLLEAAESDSRVDPLHARKMAARLQAATSSSQPVLLRLETRAGHGIGKPRAKQLEELTDIWSFIFQQLGLAPETHASEAN